MSPCCPPDMVKVKRVQLGPPNLSPTFIVTASSIMQYSTHSSCWTSQRNTSSTARLNHQNPVCLGSPSHPLASTSSPEAVQSCKGFGRFVCFGWCTPEISRKSLFGSHSTRLFGRITQLSKQCRYIHSPLISMVGYFLLVFSICWAACHLKCTPTAQKNL